MPRSQTNYGKLVGRIGNEYYFLDYVFKQDKHRGAVGSIMFPVTREHIDCRGAIDDFDRSHPEYEEALMHFLKRDDVEFVECIGGGRCFESRQEFNEVFDQELIDKINEAEGEQTS
jgi:hypothetical protein